jgi:Fucose permease
MAIVGGAIIPLVQGVLADRLGIHHAFFLPVICYLYIVFYALRGSTPNSERYANCLEVVYAAQGAGSNNRRYPNCLEIVQRSMGTAVAGDLGADKSIQ